MDESDEDRPPARPAVQTGQGRPPGTRGAAPSTARQPPPRQQPSAPVPAGSPPSRAIQGSQARRVGPVNNPDRSRDYVMPPSTSSSVDTDAQPAAGAHSHGSQARGARVSSNGARGRGGNNNAAAGVITHYPPTPPYHTHTCARPTSNLMYDVLAVSEQLPKILAGRNAPLAIFRLVT